MNQKDLKFEYYKSGGPGGQHKNKRNMAVRITHLPTGLSAIGQDSRSQSLNKQVALERLGAKLAQKFAKKKKRIKTHLPQSVKERVLDWKKKRGLKKNLRREKFYNQD